MAAENKQSFWEHLDVLRAAIGKIALVTVGFGMVAFFFKEQLFSVVLAPRATDLSPTAFSTRLRHGAEACPNLSPSGSSTRDWHSSSSFT